MGALQIPDMIWWYDRHNKYSNSLLNSHQSAYCKRHSTETALLYVHDHLVNAIESQQVSCLCLYSTSLLLCSLLLCRVEPTCLPDTSSSCVLQGCVLDPLLFVMYTTPLSTLISSCSLNHQLYVDDTQLFVSFLPTNFYSSIDHLQNALNRISSCMTANLLTLNSCKTEFLLICLSKQLAKIHNSSLNTSHPTGNVGFIFDEHFTFSGQILSVPKFCYYHIRQLRCIRPYLDT